MDLRQNLPLLADEELPSGPQGHCRSFPDNQFRPGALTLEEGPDLAPLGRQDHVPCVSPTESIDCHTLRECRTKISKLFPRWNPKPNLTENSGFELAANVAALRINLDEDGFIRRETNRAGRNYVHLKSDPNATPATFLYKRVAHENLRGSFSIEQETLKRQHISHDFLIPCIDKQKTLYLLTQPEARTVRLKRVVR
jgi:hypothetical protein